MSNPHPLFSRFEAFDRIAEEVSRTPRDFADSERGVRKLIDALPQRDMIEERHIENWITRTYKMAIQRMELEHGAENATVQSVHDHVLWHVRRASGIGGSEMGTIVKHFRGDRGNFTSARNLAMEKLLIMAPMPSTDEMSRGIRAEPWLQKMYHEMHEVRSDEESLKKLRGFRWDRMPHIVGTPDDIVTPVDGPRRRRITDYKAPSADVNAEYDRKGISFDYVAQVHHYSIVAQASGVAFHEMDVAAFDPRSFTVRSFPIERDTDLIKEILVCSKALWEEHVMEGVLPEDIAPDELDIQDRALIDLGMEAAIMKVLAEDISKRQKEILEQISAMGSEWHDLAVGKLDMGYAVFDRSRKWKEDELRRLSEAVSVDPDDFLKDDAKMDAKAAEQMLSDLISIMQKGEDPGPKLAEILQVGVPRTTSLDVDRLVAHLEEIGVNLTEAMDLQERFTLTRKTKGPEADQLRQVRADVSGLVDELEEVIADQAKAILAGDALEEIEV